MYCDISRYKRIIEVCIFSPWLISTLSACALVSGIYGVIGTSENGGDKALSVATDHD